jgi:Flp pilus assembly protein TadD
MLARPATWGLRSFEGVVMRVGLACLMILTLAGTPVAGATGRSSAEQVRFGIEAARRGLWQEARFRFDRALKLDEKNAAALNNLAVACEQLGDFVRAREAYEAARKLRPKNHGILQNYDLYREADEKRQHKAGKKNP